MHTVAIVVGAALIATGVGHGIASSLQLLELQSEVNQRLSLTEKFEPLFWSFLQLMQLRRLQRTLVPESPRYGKALRFAMIGMVAFMMGLALLLFGLGVLHSA